MTVGRAADARSRDRVGGRRVALALGSGGARGYAHIGVIQELEARDYEVVTIAGASMGALVGALEAGGALAGFTDWVEGLTQRDLIMLWDPVLRGGLMRADRVLAKVSDLLGDPLIEDLAIPFTAVATDLIAGKEVWFQEGPVTAAVRASIALPGVITPAVINGRLLVDGGVMNPVPIAATLAARADFTLAVDLAGEREDQQPTPLRESTARRPESEWSDRVRRSVLGWLDRRTLPDWFPRSGADADPDAAPEPPGAVEVPGLPRGLGTREVMQLSLDAMQNALSRLRVASYPADVTVTVPKSACRVLEFHRASEMISLGRALAAEALDRHESLSNGD